MARDVRRELSVFFREKYRLFPEVRLHSPEPLPRGWLEEVRAEIFQVATLGDVSLLSERLWSGLSGKVYKILYGELSVILAHYNDGTILWLDDHSSDSDFQNFVRRERLLEWLPHQVDRLVNLLIETKLNFLGKPQLVNNVMEVPLMPESQKALWAGNEQVQEVLLEQENRLADISDRVRPPMLTADLTGGFQLNFYIWTKILGKVINIHCFFGPGNTFRYRGVQLTQFVGRYLVPR